MPFEQAAYQPVAGRNRRFAPKIRARVRGIPRKVTDFFAPAGAKIRRHTRVPRNYETRDLSSAINVRTLPASG